MRTARKRVLLGRADGTIGRGVARFLLEAGWDVILVGKDAGVLEDLALWASLAACDASICVADLGDRAEVDRLVTELEQSGPPLGAVVICADVDGPTPLAEAAESDAFDTILDDNLGGSFRSVRGMLPRLETGGRVVILTSLAARDGTPGHHAVAASHAGVVGLVRALALEVAHKGITVNAILKASGETPIGREITATDVAQTLVYLLGPGASGVTGQALNVCGGATA